MSTAVQQRARRVSAVHPCLLKPSCSEMEANDAVSDPPRRTNTRRRGLPIDMIEGYPTHVWRGKAGGGDGESREGRSNGRGGDGERREGWSNERGGDGERREGRGRQVAWQGRAEEVPKRRSLASESEETCAVCLCEFEDGELLR